MASFEPYFLYMLKPAKEVTATSEHFASVEDTHLLTTNGIAMGSPTTSGVFVASFAIRKARPLQYCIWHLWVLRPLPLFCCEIQDEVAQQQKIIVFTSSTANPQKHTGWRSHH